MVLGLKSQFHKHSFVFNRQNHPCTLRLVQSCLEGPISSRNLVSLFFRDKVSLGSAGWPPVHLGNPGWLWAHCSPCTLVSQVLRLEAYATTPGFFVCNIYLFLIDVVIMHTYGVCDKLAFMAPQTQVSCLCIGNKVQIFHHHLLKRLSLFRKQFCTFVTNGPAIV